MRLFLSILTFFFLTSLCAQSDGLVPHSFSYNVDNFPDVYGGKTEWKRFMRDHMLYPAEELKNKIGGSVKIYFVVTDKGTSTMAKITQGVSPAIDKEALRLFNMLEWIPSTQLEKAINVAYSVEINFNPGKYKKWLKERGFEKGVYTDLPMDTSFAIYESADKNPSFSNKDKNFVEFVYSNLEYPEMASRQGLDGSIVMNFVIEPNGKASNIRIQKGVGGGCNEEAIRVIGLTTWKPAIKGGQYVRYRMYYTMVFSLKNTFKDNSGGSQRLGGQ